MAEELTADAVKNIEQASKDALDAQAEAMRRAAEITAATATPMEQYAQSVEELGMLLAGGHITQETYNRALAQTNSKLPTLTGSQEAYNNAVARAKSVIEGTLTPEERHAKKLAELTMLYNAGLLPLENYNRATNQLEKELGEAGEKVPPLSERLTNLGQSIGMVGDRISGFGQQMSLAVTGPIVAFAAVAVNEFSKFDDAMTKSLSIMGDLSDGTRRQMADVAKDLAASGVIGPDKLAESYFFLASAGLNAEQSMASLPVVEKFATAGAFDMARATDLLTDAQSALGLSSKDSAVHMENMTRLSDVLTKANILANASVEQFSVALTTKSGTALRLLNKDVEEGVAVLAAYADQGVKAEMAGEKLDIVLRDLQTSSRKQADDWKRLGVSVYDGSGKMLPMVQIIRQLEDKLGSMSDQQKSATFAMLGFQDRSVAAIKALLGTSDKIEAYEKGLREAGGVTKDVADKQMASFASQMKILQNQLTLVAIEIGQALAPYILQLNEYVRQGIEWWRALSPEMKQAAFIIAAVAASVGPLLVMLGSAVTALGLVVTAVGSLAGVISAGLAVAPYVAAVAAIAAAVGGITYAIVGPEGMQYAWEQSVIWLENFVTKARGFLYNIQHNFQAFMKWIPDNWRGVLTDMAGLLATYHSNMEHNTMVALKTVFRLWTVWQGWLSGMFTRLFQGEFNEAIWNGLKVASGYLIEFGKKLWEVIKNSLMGREVSFSDFFAKMGGDFQAGMHNTDLIGEMNRVMAEEGKNLKLPLEGFVSSLKSAPEFKYDIPQQMDVYADKVVQDYYAAVNTAMVEHAPMLDGGAEAMTSELSGEIGELEDEIKKQIATFGMHSDEIKQWELAQRGATDAQLDGVRALSKKLRALEDEKKAMEKAEKIMQKYASPMERFKKTEEELKGLLDKNRISLQAFNYEMAEARKQMAKDLKVDFKVTGIDAVEAGSAEAMARLDAFRKHRDMTERALKGEGVAAVEPVAPRRLGPDAARVDRFQFAVPDKIQNAKEAEMARHLEIIADNTRKEPGEIMTIKLAEL